MKLQQTSAFMSLMAGSLLAFSATSAQAFAPFKFDTTFSPNPADSKKDIKLEKVTFGSKTYKDFLLVTGATIVQNDLTTGTQQGPGSSDHGDGTVSDTTLPQGPKKENPTNDDIVASLGNLNLNSIIDTEDNLGTSVIEIFFGQATDTFFFWERGNPKSEDTQTAGNSDLLVESLDKNGTVLEAFKITRDLWKYAGYSINTKEIDKDQKVGSLGLKGSKKAVRLRLSSSIGFNGPDYKVVAQNVSVPEPASLAGLGMVAGALVVSRRRRQAAKVS
ncbi:PEP-CTERM sorting domain-containing protein [Coleofasciculus sp. FACHB-64]|uniref:exosortase-dependent surface protein XDP2 n=1 Tax=Cyanophyceae TaxID=3028117 RepID=UPI001684CA26|nr:MULTISPECIES: exosortase-dependent surface protein XDP2 [unclassified Coleofasciculus]MBD1837702.1 PEP-CTERM sorting domain-containing protein [Coleofasciculus sp. FACHB-501]MBD2046956.1 PEP-CTERM sorting domain-containing protein [Coleofasciculus sp. FACHB-64]